MRIYTGSYPTHIRVGVGFGLRNNGLAYDGEHYFVVYGDYVHVYHRGTDALLHSRYVTEFSTSSTHCRDLAWHGGRLYVLQSTRILVYTYDESFHFTLVQTISFSGIELDGLAVDDTYIHVRWNRNVYRVAKDITALTETLLSETGASDFPDSDDDLLGEKDGTILSTESLRTSLTEFRKIWIHEQGRSDYFHDELNGRITGIAGHPDGYHIAAVVDTQNRIYHLQNSIAEAGILYDAHNGRVYEGPVDGFPGTQAGVELLPYHSITGRLAASSIDDHIITSFNLAYSLLYGASYPLALPYDQSYGVSGRNVSYHDGSVYYAVVEDNIHKVKRIRLRPPVLEHPPADVDLPQSHFGGAAPSVPYVYNGEIYYQGFRTDYLGAPLGTSYLPQDPPARSIKGRIGFYEITSHMVSGQRVNRITLHDQRGGHRDIMDVPVFHGISGTAVSLYVKPGTIENPGDSISITDSAGFGGDTRSHNEALSVSDHAAYHAEHLAPITPIDTGNTNRRGLHVTDGFFYFLGPAGRVRRSDGALLGWSGIANANSSRGMGTVDGSDSWYIDQQGRLRRDTPSGSPQIISAGPFAGIGLTRIEADTNYMCRITGGSTSVYYVSDSGTEYEEYTLPFNDAEWFCLDPNHSFVWFLRPGPRRLECYVMYSFPPTRVQINEPGIDDVQPRGMAIDYVDPFNPRIYILGTDGVIRGYHMGDILPYTGTHHHHEGLGIADSAEQRGDPRQSTSEAVAISDAASRTADRTREGGDALSMDDSAVSRQFTALPEIDTGSTQHRGLMADDNYFYVQNPPVRINRSTGAMDTWPTDDWSTVVDLAFVSSAQYIIALTSGGAGGRIRSSPGVDFGHNGFYGTAYDGGRAWQLDRNVSGTSTELLSTAVFDFAGWSTVHDYGVIPGGRAEYFTVAGGIAYFVQDGPSIVCYETEAPYSRRPEFEPHQIHQGTVRGIEVRDRAVYILYSDGIIRGYAYGAEHVHTESESLSISDSAGRSPELSTHEVVGNITDSVAANSDIPDAPDITPVGGQISAIFYDGDWYCFYQRRIHRIEQDGTLTIRHSHVAANSAPNSMLRAGGVWYWTESGRFVSYDPGTDTLTAITTAADGGIGWHDGLVYIRDGSMIRTWDGSVLSDWHAVDAADFHVFTILAGRIYGSTGLTLGIPYSPAPPFTAGIDAVSMTSHGSAIYWLQGGVIRSFSFDDIHAIDTLLLSDSAEAGASRIYGESPRDSLAITDSASRDSAVPASDALSIADSAVSRVILAVRRIADALSITDSGRTELVRRSPEDLRFSDLATAVLKVNTVRPSDALSIADSAVSRITGVLRTVTEHLALADHAAAVPGRLRGIAELLDIREDVSHTADRVRSAVDGVIISTAAQISAEFTRRVTDAVTITDASVTAGFESVRRVYDTLRLSDSADRAGRRAAVSAISITDSVSAAVLRFRGAVLQLSISERTRYWVGRVRGPRRIDLSDILRYRRAREDARFSPRSVRRPYRNR